MAYHVHICNMGKNVDPSVAVTRSNLPIDKVYLLGSKDIRGRVGEKYYLELKDAEKKAINILKSNGVKSIEVKEVESWDLESTIDAILDIASKERQNRDDVKFHINFTSGTHIMSGAACCAAFYIGADLYYIMNKEDHGDLTAEEELKLFNIPSLPDVSKIKGFTKESLLAIEKNGKLSNRELRAITGLSPSKQGYHTGILNSMGLIKPERSGTEVNWSITYSGNIASKIIMRAIN